MRSEPPPHPMHPYHSARPVAARWHRINDLIDCGRRPCHELDDAWIRRGWAYVLRLRACRLQHDRENLSREFPDMDAAYRLNTSDDKMEHAVVEARLLARQTVDEVAVATGLPNEAVTAYEAIFFQVLGRLDAPLFIIPQAIGMSLTGEGLRETDTDILLRLLAYQAGPPYLERVLRYFRVGIRIPQPFDHATRAELEELAAMLGVRAVILAKVLPFPQCRRATVLMQLSNELRAYVDSLSDVNSDREDLREILPNVRVVTTGRESKQESKQDHGQTHASDWPPAFVDAIAAA